MPGGLVKVFILPLAVTSTPIGPKNAPRIGVANSGLIATPLARKLDETGNVQVISPAKYSAGDAAGSFDTLTRSEFIQSLAAGCRQSRVDYALYTGAPQTSAGISPTAFLFGFGRTKQTNSFEMRLYDCRSHQPVWDVTVNVEDSSGLWTNMMMGKVSAGGSQSQDAAAQMISNKLVADMAFVGSSETPSRPPDAPTQQPGHADGPASTMVMSRPGHLYDSPSPNRKVVRTLAVGTILFLSGPEQGVWKKVTDEEGDSGWVSMQVLSPYSQ